MVLKLTVFRIIQQCHISCSSVLRRMFGLSVHNCHMLRFRTVPSTLITYPDTLICIFDIIIRIHSISERSICLINISMNRQLRTIRLQRAVRELQLGTIVKCSFTNCFHRASDSCLAQIIPFTFHILKCGRCNCLDIIIDNQLLYALSQLLIRKTACRNRNYLCITHLIRDDKRTAGTRCSRSERTRNQSTRSVRILLDTFQIVITAYLVELFPILIVEIRHISRLGVGLRNCHPCRFSGCCRISVCLCFWSAHIEILIHYISEQLVRRIILTRRIFQVRTSSRIRAFSGREFDII